MAETLLDSVDISDRGVFDSFIEEYYAPMFAFAMRIIKNNHIAEDVVQDAFANLWENRKRISDKVYAKHFLYTIIRNYSIDYFRALKKQHNRFNHDIPDNDDFSTSFIKAETLKLLHEAIETLPPRSAQVIKLSLEGMKQNEIAEVMGIQLSTVKALKADGINKLRKILGPAFWLLLFHLS